MIRVSVLYPRTEGAGFDMDYYRNSHMPMVLQRVGDACKGAAIDEGLAGGMPGEPAPFVAVAHMMFDSVEASAAAFTPHAREIMADVANYTTIRPMVQIARVRTLTP